MKNRSRTARKVCQVPIVKGFSPFGVIGEITDSTPVVLLLEEYEAIRLCDYEMLNHHQSSFQMGVSRPTFTRVYASALRKIAKAMVEGRHISIEGGKVYFDSDWYQCNTCGCKFSHWDKTEPMDLCALCKGTNFEPCDNYNE
jgi:uncharacterized protein